MTGISPVIHPSLKGLREGLGVPSQKKGTGYVEYRFKIHSGALPQLRTLKGKTADKLPWTCGPPGWTKGLFPNAGGALFDARVFFPVEFQESYRNGSCSKRIREITRRAQGVNIEATMEELIPYMRAPLTPAIFSRFWAALSISNASRRWSRSAMA
jgi:hypothetical protein